MGTMESYSWGLAEAHFLEMVDVSWEVAAIFIIAITSFSSLELTEHHCT